MRPVGSASVPGADVARLDGVFAEQFADPSGSPRAAEGPTRLGGRSLTTRMVHSPLMYWEGQG